MPSVHRYHATTMLRTARLLLRRPRLDDAEALFQHITSQVHVTRYVGWPRHDSADVTRAVLKRMDELWEATGLGPLLAFNPHTKEVVGTTGLLPRDGDTAERGYVLAKPFWGRGLATEVTAAMLDLAREVGLREEFKVGK